MRRGVIYIIIGIGLMLAACDIETSDNGDLDGYWHLVRVDTLSTGGSCDMSEELVFWALQMRLLNVVDHLHDPDHFGYFLRFEHKDNTLRVYNPYVNSRKDGDIKVEDAAVLAPFGINKLEEIYQVEQLDGDDMRLANDWLRLSFEKM